MSGKKWTVKEDEYLKENHNKKTYKEIGKYLNRTEDAIQRRCRSLNLNKTKEKKIFTCNDDKKLIEFTSIQLHTVHEISQFLNKDIEATIQRCIQLNISAKDLNPLMHSEKKWYDTINYRKEKNSNIRMPELNYNNWISYENIIFSEDGNIDTKKNIGAELPFKYNNLEGYIVIKDTFVENNHTYVNIQYKDFEIYATTFQQLKNCNLGGYLNKIAIKTPGLVKFLINEDDKYNYTYSSNKKTDFYCFECKSSYSKTIYQASYEYKLNGKPSCKYCSDGLSSYTKFVISIVKQSGYRFLLEINKNTEINGKKIFKFLKNADKNWRYDIYIITDNFINNIVENMSLDDISVLLNTLPDNELEKIFWEVNGNQHDEDEDLEEYCFNDKQKRKDIVKNDNDKEKYLKPYGFSIEKIKFYGEPKSLEEYIACVKNSRLLELLQISANEIDFNEAWEFCHKSLVVEAWEFWNKIKNDESSYKIEKIAKALGVCPNTVKKYLLSGRDIGKCDYDPKEEQRKANIKSGKLKGHPLVAKLPNGKEIPFNSASECADKSIEFLGVYCSQSGISYAMSGRYGKNNSHMYNGIIFYEQGKTYDKNKCIDVSKYTKIIATKDNIDYPFDSIQECIKYFERNFDIKLQQGNIYKCLNGIRNHTKNIMFRKQILHS